MIEVKKSDVIKAIYFISSIAQEHGHAMHGSLSSKEDLIGGIFDRWINVIPESLIFNKEILPSISNGNEVEVISDFYKYDPSIAGIAPDVIGLKINKQVVPLAVFDEKWIPVPNKPQIEVKTFKEKQKMVSLRNQNYDGKYLVMVESDFKVDYLIPFFSDEVINDEIYEKMIMDDDKFIISNNSGALKPLHKLDNESDVIGTLNLLTITTIDDFVRYTTLCEANVSVERVDSIVEHQLKGKLERKKLVNYCEVNGNLYRFKSNWYDGISDGIPFYKISKKGNTRGKKLLIRTLDFYCMNVEDVIILRRTKSAMYIKSKKDNIFNDVEILKDKVYKITFKILPREDNAGEEYFIQKNLIKYIPNKEEELKEKLSNVIEEIVG